MLLSVSTEVAVLYAVALFSVLIVIPAGITLLKGQRALFVAGLLVAGLVWWITAFRLARPDSWWARRYYGPDKQRRSQNRYGAAAD